MPIDTPAILTYEVQSISIDGAGACQVLLEVRLGAQRLQAMQVQLDAPSCAPVWAGVPDAGVPRWTDLRAQLYALLRAQGAIPG